MEEKVKVVLITLARLCSKVPEGYSKSIDKVRQNLKALADIEIKQYLDNQEKRQRQYLTIDEATLTEEGIDDDKNKETTEQ